MRIVLLDQNLTRELVPWLRQRRTDWTVHHASDLALGTATDEEIAEWAQAHDAFILTENGDFADRRTNPPGRLPGVIRLRVFPTTLEIQQEALERLFKEFSDADLVGSVAVVDRRKVRLIRPSREMV